MRAPKKLTHLIWTPFGGPPSPEYGRGLRRLVLLNLVRERPAFRYEPPAEVEDLSKRELEVLKCLAQGWSNQEIGEHLYLSEATVKTYISRILFKLKLRDRVQAVVYAFRYGLDSD